MYKGSNRGKPDIEKVNQCSPVKYGELAVLGCYGFLPQEDKDRRSSKFTLNKRVIPNGVKPVKRHLKNKTEQSELLKNKAQFIFCCTISENENFIVQYWLDKNTDMFQIGRASVGPIDFIVANNGSGDKTTISRFACRIIVDRDPPYIARIYAGGFDGSSNILLGESSTKLNMDSQIDGLTTNGILIMNPGSQPGIWREVSVNGGLYGFRESRSDQKLVFCENEHNILRDGTLIDLFGTTLLWRSADGLTQIQSSNELKHQIALINAGLPQCAVGRNTLVPTSLRRSTNDFKIQSYIYLGCGHVYTTIPCGIKRDYMCPLCKTRGRFQKPLIGEVTSFYVGKEGITHCFSPCGHAASEKTVKYWSKILVHDVNKESFLAACPFCGKPLEGDPGYVELRFQDDFDKLHFSMEREMNAVNNLSREKASKNLDHGKLPFAIFSRGFVSF